MATTEARWNLREREIASRYFGQCERRQMGNEAIGREIGCSSPLVSQLRAQTYTGRVGLYIAAMVRAMERSEARDRYRTTEIKFTRTSVAERVIGALRLVHVRGDVGVIIGPTGVGKTCAAREYASEQPDTIYLIGGPNASPKSVLNLIATEVGLSWCGPQFDLRNALCRRLSGTGRLLILDEADFVSETTVQHLRIIQDESRIGLAILGTEAYLGRLRGRRSPTLNQFLGRVGLEVHVGECSDADLGMIADGYNLDGAALAVLFKGAQGQARRAVKALANARAMSNNGMSAAVLVEAFEQLPKLL